MLFVYLDLADFRPSLVLVVTWIAAVLSQNGCKAAKAVVEAVSAVKNVGGPTGAASGGRR
jgi:hypothetical protein